MVQLIIDFAYACKRHGESKQLSSVPIGKPSVKLVYSDIINRTNGAGVSVSLKGNSIYTYQSGRCIDEDKVPESFDINEELALAIIEALN